MKKVLLFLLLTLLGLLLLFILKQLVESNGDLAFNSNNHLLSQSSILKDSSEMSNFVGFQAGKHIQCDILYKHAELFPKFIGGEAKLLKYHSDEILAIIAESNESINSLNYSLLISKDGSVLESEILTQLDLELKQILEGKLLKMPCWIAGKVKGENVCMRINIPINCIRYD